MQSFVNLDQKLGPVPPSIVASIATIERAVGREERHRAQRPALLDNLAHRARIESVRASNAIEDLVLDQRRLRRIVSGSAPKTRPEAEVAGYRDALDHLLGLGAPSQFTVTELLRVHRLLFGRTDSPGGYLKTSDNRVIDVDPDGNHHDRFLTVPARTTPHYLRELHERLDIALDAGTHHPILVVAAYVLDLLVIHPFDNGNGRTARLATTALLNAHGYHVVRYVSIEGLIDRNANAYYDALAQSTAGWHEHDHDLWPWIGYLTERIAAAYRDFDELMAAASPGGTKTERVATLILDDGPAVFNRDDLRDALPDVGDATITRVLQQLRKAGRIRLRECGAQATWERIE